MTNLFLTIPPDQLYQSISTLSAEVSELLGEPVRITFWGWPGKSDATIDLTASTYSSNELKVSGNSLHDLIAEFQHRRQFERSQSVLALPVPEAPKPLSKPLNLDDDIPF